jgi:hypothetical protein
MKVFQSHAAQGLRVSDPALCELDDLFGHQPRGWVITKLKLNAEQVRSSASDIALMTSGSNACPARNGRIGMAQSPRTLQTSTR